MTISVVLADANILFSRTLRDYFLYVADAGAFEIHWSQQILDEMSRSLRARLGLDHAATERLEELMNDFIEYALIEADPADVATAEAVEMAPRIATSSQPPSPPTSTSSSPTTPSTSPETG